MRARAGLSPLYGSVQVSGNHEQSSEQISAPNDTPELDHQEGSGAELDQDHFPMETLKENKLEDRYVDWIHKNQLLSDPRIK